MTNEEFEKLVDDALSQFPAEFKQKLDNLDVVVQDWPDRSLARGRLLLGLYQGVPKTIWGRGQGLRIPDKITIFRGPIELLSKGNLQFLKSLIKSTVEHEIAHHFGIGDLRLKEIEEKS